MGKPIDLMVSLIGAGVILFLLFLGINLKRLRSWGPGWMRTFVIAGLALLGISGSTPDAAHASEWVQNPFLKQQVSGADLASNDTGKDLLHIWNEAEEVASGKRGLYPFDEKGKVLMLANLEKASGLIDELVKKRVFQASEGDLLKVDLRELVNGVQEKRPTEMQRATCYEPMMATPIKESFERLSARLPFLEKMSKEKISLLVTEKILTRIEQDLKILGTRAPEKQYDKVDESRAGEVEAKVKKQLETIRKGMGQK